MILSKQIVLSVDKISITWGNTFFTNILWDPAYKNIE